MLYFQPILVFSNSSIRFLCCVGVADVVVDVAVVVVVVCYGRKIPIFEPTRIMIESSTHSAVFSSLQFCSVGMKRKKADYRRPSMLQTGNNAHILLHTCWRMWECLCMCE